MHNWVSHCNKTGGWCTYSDVQSLKERLELPHGYSVDGWTQPHLCVTAGAAIALYQCKDVYKDYLERTLSFLTAHQSVEGVWKSYWWTSPLYATSLALQSLAKAGNTYHHLINKSIGWILSQQSKEGSWQNPYTNLPSAFYTALAIKALTVSGFSYSFQAIRKGVRWLLDNQFSDGSWYGQHILRIPSPDTTDPTLFKNWRKSSFGVNTVVDDHRRIFTSATVLNSLITVSEFFNRVSNDN